MLNSSKIKILKEFFKIFLIVAIIFKDFFVCKQNFSDIYSKHIVKNILEEPTYLFRKKTRV